MGCACKEARRSEWSTPFARLATKQTARTALVPSGCSPKRRLRRRSPWFVGRATTCVARLASIRFGPCSAIVILMQRLPRGPPHPASARGSSRRGRRDTPNRDCARNARRRRHRGETRRLLGRKLRGRNAEVALRRSLGTEHAVAPLDHVEVELEDALLRQHCFQQHGHDGLLGLAHVAFRGRQEQVLRELLRDRRAAGDDTALLPFFSSAFWMPSQSKPECSTNFASSAAIIARFRLGDIFA